MNEDEFGFPATQKKHFGQTWLCFEKIKSCLFPLWAPEDIRHFLILLTLPACSGILTHN